MGIEVQKSAIPILFNFARVKAASHPHVCVFVTGLSAILNLSAGKVQVVQLMYIKTMIGYFLLFVFLNYSLKITLYLGNM